MKPNDHVAAHVNGLKSSLHAVEVQLTILKQLIGTTKKTTGREETEEEENEEDETETLETSDDTETDETQSDESDESEEESEETDESEEDEKPAKKASGKVTSEQLNNACKARLQTLIKRKKMTAKKAFATVKALLQENFDTDSVAQIAKEDRARALKVLTAPVK